MLDLWDHPISSCLLFKVYKTCGSRESVSVSVCVVFLGKTLNSHSASLQQGAHRNGWVPVNIMHGVTLRWTSIPYPSICCLIVSFEALIKNYEKIFTLAFKEARKGFFCCSVCEMMEDYKEEYLMVWASYTSPCNSVVGLFFDGTCDVISVTMAMHKVHKNVH